MRPLTILRKTVKHAGAVFALLLVAAWIFSIWLHVDRLTAGGWSIGIGHGCVVYDSVWHRGSSGLLVSENARPFHELRWWVRSSSAFAGKHVEVPLWFLAAPISVAAVAAHRLDTLARRRARTRAGRCTSCGYDLRALPPAGACPECGHGAAPPPDIPVA